jgi:hypothetical protein
MNCMPWIKLYGHLPSSLCLAQYIWYTVQSRLAQLLGQGLRSLTVELPSGLDRESITLYHFVSWKSLQDLTKLQSLYSVFPEVSKI